MAWTTHPELRHVNAVIAERLAERQATAAAAIPGSIEHAAVYAKCMGWVWFQAPDADGNPQRYACAITSDPEATNGLKQDADPGQFYDPGNDRWHDIAEPLVAVWRTKIVRINDEPNAAEPLLELPAGRQRAYVPDNAAPLSQLPPDWRNAPPTAGR